MVLFLAWDVFRYEMLKIFTNVLSKIHSEFMYIIFPQFWNPILLQKNRSWFIVLQMITQPNRLAKTFIG